MVVMVPAAPAAVVHKPSPAKCKHVAVEVTHYHHHHHFDLNLDISAIPRSLARDSPLLALAQRANSQKFPPPDRVPENAAVPSEVPWLSYMSTPNQQSRCPSSSGGASGSYLAPPDAANNDPNPPTVAPFSKSPSPSERASYHQVFQKSPLLVSTPPQVTKALSQVYPYAKFANQFAGLLTWTTEDPWESFLLVAAFWAVTLYGDLVIKWFGNILIVLVLALGMFARNQTRKDEHPSLDDILDTLQLLSARLAVLTDPFSSLAAFLSVGQSPTTATMGPTLITLFIRILFVSPIWITLCSSPFRIITPRRVVMFVGTTFLSWHSRPARVTRTILWRSAMIRDICERITGLNLTPQEAPEPPPLPPRANALSRKGSDDKSGAHKRTPSSVVASHFKNKSSPLGNLNQNRGTAPGVRFTFSIYENQRRWLGVGWTSSLFAYERPAWTDEHLSACPPVEDFYLPEAKNGMKWRWVESQKWQVEGEEDGKKAGNGWVYYDNKWRNGKRGVDSWSAYTRRRRWYRNAELVEDDAEDDDTGTESIATTENTSATNETTITETEEAPSK
ncbi:peroxisome- protein [Orbilia oligospora]|uniref:Peroxisome-protein n=1 Tax=Orbilia oligospora TaxID=2813651 RepID=A0A8H2DZP2_ORBOL|nr:peroxisome- protein [Orbilia oligospora]